MEVQMMVLPVPPLEMHKVQVQMMVLPVRPLEMHKVRVQVQMMVLQVGPLEMHKVQVLMQARLQLPSVQRRLGSLQQRVQQNLKNQAPSASHIWPRIAPIQAGASSLVSPRRPSLEMPQPQTVPERSSLKLPLVQCSDELTKVQRQLRLQRQICSPCAAGAAKGSPGVGFLYPPCQPYQWEGRNRSAPQLTSGETSSTVGVGAGALGGPLGSRLHSS